MYGGLAGAGMTVTPGVTFGVSVDRNTTDADLPGASGRIDMTQIGAIGAFEKGRGRSASPSFTASAT